MEGKKVEDGGWFLFDGELDKGDKEEAKIMFAKAIDTYGVGFRTAIDRFQQAIEGKTGKELQAELDKFDEKFGNGLSRIFLPPQSK